MRNHKVLEKHIKKNGFTCIRHNGCHHIYAANDGRTLVLPYRTGSHLLAPKTVKRILDVINGGSTVCQ